MSKRVRMVMLARRAGRRNALLLDALPCLCQQAAICFELGQQSCPLFLLPQGLRFEPLLGFLKSGLLQFKSLAQAFARFQLGWPRRSLSSQQFERVQAFLDSSAQPFQTLDPRCIGERSRVR